MPFFVALAAVAGIVISTLFIQRGSLIIGAVLYLLIASVFGFDYWNFPCGPITMSLDRIALLWLVGTYVVQRRMGIHDPKPITGVEKALFAFCTLLVVNTFLFDWRRDVAGQVAIVPHLLNGYIIPLALYWIVRNSAITERQMQWLQYLFIGFGVYLAFTAFCEITGTWSLVFPKFIADPEFGIHFGRARGPFVQSVRLGMYLTAGVVMMWTLLGWQGLWGRWGRLLALSLLPLFMGALFVTYTRTNWLGTALAAVLVCGCTFRGVFRRIGMVALFVGVILAVGVVSHKMVSFDRESTAVDTAQSTKMRASFAYVSWLMFQDQPVSGHGFGHFPHKNLPFLEDRDTELQLGQIRGYIHHNTFLSLLVELGVLGLLSYSLVLAGWGSAAWRLWNNSSAPTWMRGHALVFLAFLVSYLVHMLFHDVSYSPMENGSLFLFAGLASGLHAMARRAPHVGARQLAAVRPRKEWTRAPALSAERAINDFATLRPRVNLFGVSIDAIRMPLAVARIQEWIRSETDICRYVVTPNVDHTVMLQESAALRKAYDEASMVLVDGAPVVLAARLLGKDIPERVAGSDLVPALFAASPIENPITVYLLGAMPGVAEQAAERIHRQWPGVRVVGSYSPPFGFERIPERTREILERIGAVSPDVLIVGLGAPKQELWVHQFHRTIPAKVALCVGATIDFLADEKPRAPLWMRKSGLEWSHRLAREPRRLFGRYARDAWVFPQLVCREWRGL